MSLVNVRVKHLRPKYNNLKEWCEDKNNIYIGRKCVVFIDGQRYPKYNSLWANPYKKGTKEEIIRLYEEHLINLLKDPDNLEEFKNLKGKNLGCWCVCKPKEWKESNTIECHGDIILKYLEL